MSSLEAREAVLELVQAIVPFDRIEANDKAAASAWIKSGAEIFRIQKPDIPLKHLVAYFVVFDRLKMKLLLVDHIKAQRWLPTGGHVDMNENPKDTVSREMQEELKLPAHFTFSEPLFITETVTVGLTAGHRDVSLWYVVDGNADQVIDFDSNEFKSYRWFTFEEVWAIDIHTLDPHMHRFVQKLQAHVKANA